MYRYVITSNPAGEDDDAKMIIHTGGYTNVTSAHPAVDTARAMLDEWCRNNPDLDTEMHEYGAIIERRLPLHSSPNYLWEEVEIIGYHPKVQ